MANTTSGTTTFDKSFSIDEIIEEAYDRLGIFTLNGGHMKTARRSLNKHTDQQQMVHLMLQQFMV
jgi:hypothetical protein